MVTFEEVGPVSVAQRLDRLQRDRPWAGFPIAVLYKFFDDQGSYLHDGQNASTTSGVTTG